MANKPNVLSRALGKGSPANAESCKAAAAAAHAIGEPEDDSGVCDAFYPMGAQPHNHHLQSADEDIAMAVWAVGEGVRQKEQEDANHDETIKE